MQIAWLQILEPFLTTCGGAMCEQEFEIGKSSTELLDQNTRSARFAQGHGMYPNPLTVI